MTGPANDRSAAARRPRTGWAGELTGLDAAVYAAIATTPTPQLDRGLRLLSRAADHSKDQSDVNHLQLATQAAACGALVFGLFGNILWTKGFWFAWMLLAAASALDDSPRNAVAGRPSLNRT